MATTQSIALVLALIGASNSGSLLLASFERECVDGGTERGKWIIREFYSVG